MVKYSKFGSFRRWVYAEKSVGLLSLFLKVWGLIKPWPNILFWCPIILGVAGYVTKISLKIIPSLCSLSVFNSSGDNELDTLKSLCWVEITIFESTFWIIRPSFNSFVFLIISVESSYLIPSSNENWLLIFGVNSVNSLFSETQDWISCLKSGV